MYSKRDHPTVQEKMVIIDRWSRKQGSPKYDFPKLFRTVAIVVVWTRSVHATQSHIDLLQAVASRDGSHSQTCGGGC